MPRDAIACERCGRTEGVTWSPSVYAWRCAAHKPPPHMTLLAAIAEEAGRAAGLPACERCQMVYCVGCSTPSSCTTSGPDPEAAIVASAGDPSPAANEPQDPIAIRLIAPRRPLVAVVVEREYSSFCLVMSDGFDDVGAMANTPDAAIGEMVARYAPRLGLELPPVPIAAERLGVCVRGLAAALGLQLVDLLGYVGLRAAAASATSRASSPD